MSSLFLALAEAVVLPCSGMASVLEGGVAETFDPEKAGWRKTFEDTFDGSGLDTNAWHIWRGVGTDLIRVEDGQLKIGVDFKPGSESKPERTTADLQTGGIWSNRSFLFGYFEARVRFTHQPGWWSAFWLFGNTNRNPYVDGLEIDIFEDYSLKDGYSSQITNCLAHNLHVYGSRGAIRTWHYHSPLPDSADGWYTIGCKWTPSEIAYYLDGKLIRSESPKKEDPVVFDAVRHANCTAPLCVILNGVVFPRSWKSKLHDISHAKFPEWYCVDRVSVWECPDIGNRAPQVVWTKTPRDCNGRVFARRGERLEFSADVFRAPNSGTKIRKVSLFDSGMLLETRTNSPYAFSVPFDRKFYAKTHFADTGSEHKEVFDDLHAFVVFAEDEDGRVGYSTPILVMQAPEPTSGRPYGGKATRVPGTIRHDRYDEGGEGVSYHDISTKHPFLGQSWAVRTNEAVGATVGQISSIQHGEWINYTVNVESEGWYELDLSYSRVRQANPGRIDLFADDRYLGTLLLTKASRSEDTGKVCHKGCITVRLAAGIQTLRLLMSGGFGVGNFSLVKIEKQE